MTRFLEHWHAAAATTLGLFWMALWAFVLGYFISSLIQVFVSRKRMQQSMGDTDAHSVFLGSVFGFISSSCSFSALATTRALFSKGAGLIPSLSFLLASTNLVIELGIVIAVFLGWQFVIGEYAGGVLLIMFMWLLVARTLPPQLAERAREHARKQEQSAAEGEIPDWRQLIRNREGWLRVSDRYVMEWQMVWKDVTIGFTVAGLIAAFAPRSFFQWLFVGSDKTEPAFTELLLQAIAGPLAAFFTFIGSMGNIPMAAVLYNNGVSFAGVMAFIFSDLVVLPVLRIQARYYGWKMSLYILAVFLAALVTTALLLHYSLAAFDLLPGAASTPALTDREMFAVDYTMGLNILALALSIGLLVWKWRARGLGLHGSDKLGERVLFWLAMLAFAWLAVGSLLPVLAR